MWSIVRGKEYLQADLRAAKAASRDLDEKGLRRWARERIGGLADAMAGRRNEHVRRVLGTYIDEIVVYPSNKTGVMRVNAGLAALVEAGRIGVDDPALRPVRANGRPQDANGRQRGGNAWPRNANDRPEGRSWASGIAGERLSINPRPPGDHPDTAAPPRAALLFHFRWGPGGVEDAA